MDAHVESAIKACITYQQHDKTAVTHTSPPQPVPYPNAAWVKLPIDIVGPFNSARLVCCFAITLNDYFRKWPEISFLSQVTSTTVIKFLLKVFSTEGNPKELISDNGSQFTSQEFETFLKDRDITHRNSAVSYPQVNGEIERFNRSLKESLLIVNIEREDWKTFTMDFLQTYRAT